jgi:hypothetical protein
MISISAMLAAGVICLQCFVLNADAAANTDHLDPGERLTAGERLVSADGRYVLTMQDDGNLVEYAPGNVAVWAAGTDQPTSEARLQPDGNLVVIAPGDVPVWSTHTNGSAGSTLELQSDGNVVVYAPGHLVRWSSDSGAPVSGEPQQSEPETPAAPVEPASDGTAARLCRGWGGVANNVVGAAVGSLRPAILGERDLGTPTLDGNVVRVDSKVSFYGWGACGNQIAFQMQTKACGAFGCHWETRNHGKWEFFWAHDDTGEIAQQVTMSCRPGTNSYRVHMAVVGLASTGDIGENGKAVAGAEVDSEGEDGPVVKLTC